MLISLIWGHRSASGNARPMNVLCDSSSVSKWTWQLCVLGGGASSLPPALGWTPPLGIQGLVARCQPLEHSQGGDGGWKRGSKGPSLVHIQFSQSPSRHGTGHRLLQGSPLMSSPQTSGNRVQTCVRHVLNSDNTAKQLTRVLRAFNGVCVWWGTIPQNAFSRQTGYL